MPFSALCFQLVVSFGNFRVLRTFCLHRICVPKGFRVCIIGPDFLSRPAQAFDSVWRSLKPAPQQSTPQHSSFPCYCQEERLSEKASSGAG